ncbi:hypothetical protein, partial [Oscillatoria sp. FACHB-1406]|uniref:hypothetical protein n=1 Tax=Oscillatoria sp. FACHB-1406 TaxID=2692846 RepID=UPI001A7EA6E8
SSGLELTRAGRRDPAGIRFAARILPEILKLTPMMPLPFIDRRETILTMRCCPWRRHKTEPLLISIATARAELFVKSLHQGSIKYPPNP